MKFIILVSHLKELSPSVFSCIKDYRKTTMQFTEYCAGEHWILYWIQENKTATHFLRFRLFTYAIMKKCQLQLV